MATLGDLLNQFGHADTEIEEPGVEKFASDNNFAVEDDGQIASGGENMKSLTDIYLAMADTDFDKEAGVAAGAPEYQEEYVQEDEGDDFAKMAEAIAYAEADEIVEEDGNIVKVAQEYDSAGRIMARGFFDEFNKLAGAMDTDVSSNQMTESPSAASTPALGNRGLPTVETNFAGNDAHDGQIETAGPAGKQVYKDVLKPAKTIAAGMTGDDPEAAAISLGGGSPAGFATVKDLQA